uniref:Thioredoxin domain-containing protein n=1 Tax=Globisporangium ultimum (strain ATCC 200006 / CBS 805.95 / DAOM BR144) TaxID=431595 RepID=K3W587_GLOUD
MTRQRSGGRGVVRTALLALVFALALVGSATVVAAKKKAVLSGSDKVAELNGRVRDGVVPLTTELYEKYVLRPDRPYHLFLLFTAMADKYSCDVCKQIAPEYLVLGESYLSAKQVKVDTRDGLDVFFGIVDFDVNQQVFGIYGFTSAPHVVYIGPDRTEDTGKRSPSKVQLSDSDLYNVYSGGKKAESINAFVKQKTGFDFVIERSKAFLYAIIAVSLVVIVISGKIILSNLDVLLAKLRRKRLWMTVSLLFYGLSVSGMVYCIIREPPAFTTERNGKIKFFHPQGRSQFVVEGLIIGGYDVAAAGFMILLSQWAIYLQRPTLRYAAIAICALGFVFMYREMIACYTFKNRWYTGWMGF